MRQTAAFFGAAPMSSASYAYGDSMQCGPPIACRIEQPIQQQIVHVQAMAPVVRTVAVQQLQPVVQAIIEDVPVTEYRHVKQTVQSPVTRIEYIQQAAMEMRPVTEQRTVNVPTVDYQTVTEYKTVQKQVGRWVTNNCPTGRVNSWQYDNRPNAAGAFNRASYDLRNAFTPTTKAVRQFIPQTMTCTVPCSKRVAVNGMKQVTYNISRMVPTPTTRTVAVNKVTYEPTEITVMQPVQVVKRMQTGTRVSYAPVGSGSATAGGSNGTQLGLQPTPDANSKAKPRTAKADEELEDGFNTKQDKRSSSTYESDRDGYSMTRPSQMSNSPSVIRVSQWVAARTPLPSPSTPQPSGKSAAISIADSTR